MLGRCWLERKREPSMQERMQEQKPGPKPGPNMREQRLVQMLGPSMQVQRPDLMELNMRERLVKTHEGHHVQ